MKRACVICEKDFVLSSSSQKTCGKECGWANKQRSNKTYNQRRCAKPPTKRVCAICGKGFFPYCNNYSQKTCGARECRIACRKATWTIHNEAKRKFPGQLKRTCAICNKEYFPYRNSARQKTCAENPCQKAWRRIVEQQPSYKARQKIYAKRHGKEYQQRPEVRKRRNAARRKWAQTHEGREWIRLYRQRPEVKRRAAEHSRKNYHRPGHKAHRMVYLQRPEVKRRNNANERKRRLRARLDRAMLRIPEVLAKLSQLMGKTDGE